MWWYPILVIAMVGLWLIGIVVTLNERDNGKD